MDAALTNIIEERTGIDSLMKSEYYEKKRESDAAYELLHSLFDKGE